MRFPSINPLTVGDEPLGFMIPMFLRYFKFISKMKCYYPVSL